MKNYEEINLKNPVLFASWAGLGDVGLLAIDQIRRSLNASLFAEINMRPYFPPEAVFVKDGIAKLIPAPQSLFYYSIDPDIIFFESNVQLSGQKSLKILNKILDVAEEFNVQRVYTGAALASPISFKNAAHIYGFTNSRELRDILPGYGVEILKEGVISGMNGLLLAMARKRRISGLCLLATLPHYAVNLPNPKAARALIEAFELILDIEIDKSELEENSALIEKKMAEIEDRIRGLFPVMEINESLQDFDQDSVPEYVMARIEELFNEVTTNRAAAQQLKEELDRWQLYELYEDRFLSLFR